MMAIEVYNGVIVDRVISSETDKRLVIAGGHWARKMSIGDNWSELLVAMRIATRMNITNQAGVSVPSAYLGLCAGTSAPPGSVSPNHYVGFKASTFSNFNVQPANSIYWGHNLSSNGRIVRIESGAETSGGTTMASCVIPQKASGDGAGLNGGVVMFKFTKGSPNWSVQMYSYGTSHYTRTIEQFILGAQGDFSNTNTATQSSFPVDESTYGALDSICFVNTDVLYPFEISDIAYTRLA